MNGIDVNGAMNAINACINLIVGICAVAALTRQRTPIADSIRELYNENKRDREATGHSISDHERRISHIEGKLGVNK